MYCESKLPEHSIRLTTFVAENEHSDEGLTPGEHFIESAIQLGWLNGLTAEEISRQLRMPIDEVERIVGPTESCDDTGLRLDA